MNNPNAKLSQDLAKAGAKMTKLGFDDLAANWFRDNFKRLKNLCGDEESARKIFLLALNVAAKSPQLLQCTFESFAQCIMTSCEMKLYPGPIQQCAYVPFRNNKTGKYEATFMPMYQGLVKLAFNSGFVRDVQAAVVYEKDDFDFSKGTSKYLKHKPFLGEDRGERTCCYSVIETAYGHHFEVRGMDFVDRIKGRSKASGSDFSPWNTNPDDYDAMACKTLFKQAAKWVPKSVELQQAIDLDNQLELAGSERKGNIIDVTGAIQAALPETPEELKFKMPETSQPEPEPIPAKHETKPEVVETKAVIPETQVAPTVSPILSKDKEFDRIKERAAKEAQGTVEKMNL